MNIDFSNINLQYLIQARDLAREDPEQVTVLLGISCHLAELLAEVSPEALARIPRIKTPLLIPRQEMWWWSRLLNAAKEDGRDEIEAVLEHGNLSSL